LFCRAARQSVRLTIDRMAASLSSCRPLEVAAASQVKAKSYLFQLDGRQLDASMHSVIEMNSTMNKDMPRTIEGRMESWKQWSSEHPQAEALVEIRQRGEKLNPKSHCQSNISLSVLTWNILSDTWGTKDALQRPLENREDYIWDRRMKKVLHYMAEWQPDIIFFQEVDFRWFNEMTQRLSANGQTTYSGVMQKPKKMTSAQPCGNATFWNSCYLRKTWEDHKSRALVVGLEVLKGPPRRVDTINCHLESSPSAEGAEKRSRQLFSAIKSVTRQQNDSPAAVLIGGDFNTGPDSSVAAFLRQRTFFASVYEHPKAAHTSPVTEATYAIAGHFYMIDHLWYESGALELHAVLQPLLENERLVRGSSVLPNKTIPSDHIPIGAVFHFLDSFYSHGPPNSKMEGDTKGGMPSAEVEALTQRAIGVAALAPTRTKGKPSTRELEELQAYSRTKKAFLDSLPLHQVALAKAVLKSPHKYTTPTSDCIK